MFRSFDSRRSRQRQSALTCSRLEMAPIHIGGYVLKLGSPKRDICCPTKNCKNRWAGAGQGMLMICGLAGLALFGFGCAAPDMNPATPKDNTGYLDFYANVPD